MTAGPEAETPGALGRLSPLPWSHPCNTNKQNPGDFPPASSCPVLFPRCFLSPTPLLVLRRGFIGAWGQLWSLHFGHKSASPPFHGWGQRKPFRKGHQSRSQKKDTSPWNLCVFFFFFFLSVNSTPEGDKGWWLEGGASRDSQAPDVPRHRMLLPGLNDSFAPPLLLPLDTHRNHLFSPFASCKSC